MQRFSIGLTILSHFFIHEQEEQPQCVACQTPYTVKYFLIECKDFALVTKELCTLLFSNKRNNQLIICQTLYTNKYFLFEFEDLFLIRRRFFHINNMNLFENVEINGFLFFERNKIIPSYQCKQDQYHAK